MNAPLTNESFRSQLRIFSEDCSHMSFSWMWRKQPLFTTLLEWAQTHKPMSVTVLIEEIESCGWIALDLIHELVGQEIGTEMFRSPNKHFSKLLALYRFALDHGYGSEKIQSDYDALRKKLRVEEKMDRVIRRIDIRRRYCKITSQDWKRARARLESIAKHETALFMRHALHDILLWRGYNASRPDEEVVRLVSDVMSKMTTPPKKLALATTPAEIYFAWFRGDDVEQPVPVETTA